MGARVLPECARLDFCGFRVETDMARRMILVLTLGVLIGLAGAPGWRWLERSLFESLPVYSQLPDFQLVDASGRKFTRERLSGKVWVADFIYTRCEDTCPLQTAEMRRLQQVFGAHEDFRQISITTDPAHDKAAILAAYARKFGADRARWFFLTGKEKEIKNLALKGFRLSYATKQAALPPESIGGRVLPASGAQCARPSSRTSRRGKDTGNPDYPQFALRAHRQEFHHPRLLPQQRRRFLEETEAGVESPSKQLIILVFNRFLDLRSFRRSPLDTMGRQTDIRLL